MGQCSSTAKLPEVSPLDGTGSLSDSSNNSSRNEQVVTPSPSTAKPSKQKAARRGSFLQDSASTPVGEDSPGNGALLLKTIKQRAPVDEQNYDGGDCDSDSNDSAAAVIPSARIPSAARHAPPPPPPRQQQPMKKSKRSEPQNKNLRTKKMKERSLPAMLEKTERDKQPQDVEVSSVSKRLNNSLSSLKSQDLLLEDTDDEEKSAKSVSKRLGSSQYIAEDETQDQFQELPSTHSFRHPPSIHKKKSTRTSIQVADLEKDDLRKESTSSWYQLSCTSRTGSTYSSYHSFGQSNLSELEVTLMASQQSLGASHGFIDRMHMSRSEKNALSGLHGFCFTESEDENEPDDDEDDRSLDLDEMQRTRAAVELQWS